MQWKTRTLAELFVAEPHPRAGSGEVVVMINTEEARTLAAAGVQFSSGSENLERNTQRYRTEGKTYLWLAGYPDGKHDADFPVAHNNPRLGEILRVAKELG